MRGWGYVLAAMAVGSVQASGMAFAADTSTKIELRPTIKTAALEVKAPASQTSQRPKPSLTKAPTAKPKRKRRTNAVVATINLSRQTMTVVEHGKTIGTWTISSGKKGHITPRGSFRPKWRAKMWYSRKYNNAPMPYSVFFNGGIATHGTNHISRLGSPASKGCIRLRTHNARRFYNLVSKYGKSRVRIIVKGTTPLGKKRYARKTNRSVRRSSRGARRSRAARQVRAVRRQRVARVRAVRRANQVRRRVVRKQAAGLRYPGD